VEVFDALPRWKKVLCLRHECCHLLDRSGPSPTLEMLMKKYGWWLTNLVGYRREYMAHLCATERSLDDWLRSPVSIESDIGPRKLYRRERRTRGVEVAVYNAIDNSVKVLSFVYLFEHLVGLPHLPGQFREEFQQDLKRYNEYLDSWWHCLQKDVKCKLLSPREWLSSDDFKNEERYFGRISRLVAAITT